MYHYYPLPVFSYQPTFHQPSPFLPSQYYRQYPPIDPTLFNKSAIAMQKLMKDASTILNKLAQSKNFAFKVMSAAQESHTKEVEELIKSLGIQSKVDIYYNPDGIRLTLSAKTEQTECCRLVIALRWKVF